MPVILLEKSHKHYCHLPTGILSATAKRSLRPIRKELRRKRISVHLVSRVGKRIIPVRQPIVTIVEDVNGDVDDQYLRLLILLC